MLTDTAIRNAKPTEKTRKLFDERGLYLEVTPKGGKRWRFKYRFQGREKLLSMGVYPDVSLRQARDRREDARRLLADGIDPSAHRKATRDAAVAHTANAFEPIAREWFAKRAPNWADSHSSKIMRRLARDVFPWLGAAPVSSITAPQVLEVVRRIEARGAIDTAHRALQNISQVMRYSVATGRAERDPCGDLRGALPSITKEHFPTVTDPVRIGEILRAIEGYRGTLTVRCAMRLAPLVFVRPGELRHAQWSDIDLDKAEWRFTATKTGTAHIVPLSRQAVAILDEVEPLTGRGRYAFPSARNPRGDRPMSDNAILAAMRKLDIPKDEMVGHGWRAVARTLLDEQLGYQPHLIEHQLAHAVRDPLGRAYNRTAHLPERREMMQRWSDYLDQLKQGADVVSITTANKK